MLIKSHISLITVKCELHIISLKFGAQLACALLSLILALITNAITIVAVSLHIHIHMHTPTIEAFEESHQEIKLTQFT